MPSRIGTGARNRWVGCPDTPGIQSLFHSSRPQHTRPNGYAERVDERRSRRGGGGRGADNRGEPWHVIRPVRDRFPEPIQGAWRHRPRRCDRVCLCRRLRGGHRELCPGGIPPRRPAWYRPGRRGPTCRRCHGRGVDVRVRRRRRARLPCATRRVRQRRAPARPIGHRTGIRADPSRLGAGLSDRPAPVAPLDPARRPGCRRHGRRDDGRADPSRPDHPGAAGLPQSVRNRGVAGRPRSRGISPGRRRHRRSHGPRRGRGADPLSDR